MDQQKLPEKRYLRIPLVTIESAFCLVRTFFLCIFGITITLTIVVQFKSWRYASGLILTWIVILSDLL